MTTEQGFLLDVVEHQMTILRDCDGSRHIRFSKPGTINQRFDLITWPWHLCYVGDMGCYVFSRLEDMFDFFRTSGHGEAGLHINPYYWAEKLQAVDRAYGWKKWAPSKFEASARKRFQKFLEDKDFDAEQTAAAQEDFEVYVINEIEDGEVAANSAASNFEIDGRYPLEDFHEVDSDELTYRYLWCCYALAWGIKQYDEAKDVAAGRPTNNGGLRNEL